MTFMKHRLKPLNAVFRHMWSDQHRHTAIRMYALLAVILPLALVAAGGILLGWFNQPRPLSSLPYPKFPVRHLNLGMTLNAVDPLASAGTVTVSWSINYDSCSWNVTDSDLPHECTAVNIFMDPNLYAASNVPAETSSNRLPSVPVFQYDPYLATQYMSSQSSFQTNLAIWTRDMLYYNSIVNYPFDQYYANIWMYARVNGTDAPVGLELRYIQGVGFDYNTILIPPSSLPGTRVGDASENWHATYGNIDSYLWIRRNPFVIAYVVILVITMWIITLLLLAIAIRSAFFRYKTDATILVAPVATLFAFTTLRTSMPGSPSSFGAIIDFVGTLPSLTILVVIAIITLSQVLFKAKREHHISVAVP
ncbi:hypothetical protein PsYK624_077350 [Phanerochaete sordida]|uniref:DUF4436 domain-containing protein n=1 Tax=Phanerochaete sordida TaxID=48140 RepID=A0A9P3LDT3_9APHY|nr:hypothetical protein PsYK624_077350 [Phanerochaete sordida]